MVEQLVGKGISRLHRLFHPYIPGLQYATLAIKRPSECTGPVRGNVSNTVPGIRSFVKMAHLVVATEAADGLYQHEVR